MRDMEANMKRAVRASSAPPSRFALPPLSPASLLPSASSALAPTTIARTTPAAPVDAGPPASHDAFHQLRTRAAPALIGNGNGTPAVGAGGNGVGPRWDADASGTQVGSEAGNGGAESDTTVVCDPNTSAAEQALIDAASSRARHGKAAATAHGGGVGGGMDAGDGEGAAATDAPPKRSQGNPGKRKPRSVRMASDITRQELSSYFHLPSEMACRELGIGLTVLKRQCRKFGIKRWPFRKLKSLDRLISNVQSGMPTAGFDARPYVKSVEELEEQKRKMETCASLELDADTKRLQQAFSKANHKLRRLGAGGGSGSGNGGGGGGGGGSAEPSAEPSAAAARAVRARALTGARASASASDDDDDDEYDDDDDDDEQEERADDDDEDEGGGRVRDGHGKRRRKPNPRFTDTARPPKAAKATEKGPLALDALLAASLALGVQDHGGVGTGAAAAPGGVKHVPQANRGSASSPAASPVAFSRGGASSSGGGAGCSQCVVCAAPLEALRGGDGGGKERYVLLPCQHARTCMKCAYKVWVDEEEGGKRCPTCQEYLEMRPLPFRPDVG